MNSREEWAAKINAAWAKLGAAQSEARNLKSKRRRGSGPEALEIEIPLARFLSGKGHKVRRQVKCKGGRIDILDETDNALIECKASGSLGNIVAAADQLRLYEPAFPGFALVIAVPRIQADAQWMATALRAIGFRFIEMGE